MVSIVKAILLTSPTNPKCGQKFGLAGNSQEYNQIFRCHNVINLSNHLETSRVLIPLVITGTQSLVAQSLIDQQRTWHFQLQDSYRIMVRSLIIIW